jgi:hypothetical protein
VTGGAWLALRELAARPGRALQAAALVAVAAALGTGLELVARGREEAASVRIDAVGPALRIVPAGVGGSELMRLDLGKALLPADTLSQVVATLGPDLREARERLVVRGRVAGREVPVIGLGTGEGLQLGSALAAAVGSPPSVDLGGGARPVDGVREVTGTAEDGAIFLPLREAQALAGLPGVNEIQVYLRSGLAPQAAVARLEAARLQAKVIPGGRGAPADEEVKGALAKGRRIAQGVLALLVGLGLAVMAHLDAAERRVEVATLRAVGAQERTVWWALVARSVAVGLAGGVGGALAGGVVAAVQDPAVSPPLLAIWSLAALVAAACAALGALAAWPTALAMARRDPVPWLQES